MPKARAPIAIAAGLAALCAAGSAHAQIFSSITPEVSAGTLGAGPELDLRLASLPLGLRLGANLLDLDFHVNTSDAHYDTKTHLANGGVIADWYPFLGGFRLSAGVKFNGNNADLNETPTAGDFLTINNNTYNVAGSAVGGTIKFNLVAPYVGLGFGGTIFGGPTLAFDLGVMFEGSPKVALNATGPVTTEPGFAGNLAQEQASLQHQVNGYKFYPVVQLALGWRF